MTCTGLTCGFDPNCPDEHCHGRRIARELDGAPEQRDAAPPVWQRSGGARVQDGVGLHYVSDEDRDEPLYRPESFAAPIPRVLQILLAAVITLCMSIACGAFDALAPYFH